MGDGLLIIQVWDVLYHTVVHGKHLQILACEHFLQSFLSYNELCYSLSELEHNLLIYRAFCLLVSIIISFNMFALSVLSYQSSKICLFMALSL